MSYLPTHRSHSHKHTPGVLEADGMCNANAAPRAVFSEYIMPAAGIVQVCSEKQHCSSLRMQRSSFNSFAPLPPASQILRLWCKKCTSAKVRVCTARCFFRSARRVKLIYSALRWIFYFIVINFFLNVCKLNQNILIGSVYTNRLQGNFQLSAIESFLRSSP